MDTDERPIAAIATALSPAAIAVIRVSGRDSVKLLAQRFSRPAVLREAAGHTIHHGTIRDARGRAVDEVLVAVFRGPASYTGEEAAEIYCHGSPAGVRRVYGLLLASGFVAAGPGEFTRRAFTNGKLDLTRAEAVNEIVRTQTAAAHSLALDRLEGSVERVVNDIRRDLIGVMASLAIQLDYPEEETGPVGVDRGTLQDAGERCRKLASTYGRGRLFQDGARVAIAGRTNAGKSSLFNQLLQHDRSIVSETHGTTRDYVEALIDVEGVPVRLFDTAGLRVAGEAVEQEGIRRSNAVVAAADLVLYVVDAHEGLVPEDEHRLDAIRAAAPAICILNKVDLVPPPLAAPQPVVAVSALTGAGIERLNHAMLAILLGSVTKVSGDSIPGESFEAAAPDDAHRLERFSEAASGHAAVIDSERQRALLVRAADAVDRALESLDAQMPADIVSVDVQDALGAVGEITGEVASAEILDAMFGSFCVGK